MKVSKASRIGTLCASLVIAGSVSAECREVGLTDPGLAAFAEPAGKVLGHRPCLGCHVTLHDGAARRAGGASIHSSLWKRDFPPGGGLSRAWAVRGNWRRTAPVARRG